MNLLSYTWTYCAKVNNTYLYQCKKKLQTLMLNFAFIFYCLLFFLWNDLFGELPKFQNSTDFWLQQFLLRLLQFYIFFGFIVIICFHCTGFMWSIFVFFFSLWHTEKCSCCKIYNNRIPSFCVVGEINLICFSLLFCCSAILLSSFTKPVKFIANLISFIV